MSATGPTHDALRLRQMAERGRNSSPGRAPVAPRPAPKVARLPFCPSCMSAAVECVEVKNGATRKTGELDCLRCDLHFTPVAGGGFIASKSKPGSRDAGA